MFTDSCGSSHNVSMSETAKRDHLVSHAAVASEALVLSLLCVSYLDYSP